MSSIIIFDGYEVASTKDLTHTRRNKGKLGPTVSFTAERPLQLLRAILGQQIEQAKMCSHAWS